MAILLAGYHPSVKLLGVSTVASNQVVEKTTANALAILDWIGLKGVGGWGTADSSTQLGTLPAEHRVMRLLHPSLTG